MSNTIDTGLRPVWSSKGNTLNANFIPFTGALNTVSVKNARISRNLVNATTNYTVVVAYRMSEDGITWSSTITELGTYNASTGWVYNEGAISTLTANQMLFVQIGTNSANISGTEIEQALVQLIIELQNTGGKTLSPPPQKVWSKTTTQIFHNFTARIAIESVGEIRASIEMQGNSGDLVVTPAYQVSNDGLKWYSGVASAAEGTFATFGTAQSVNGRTEGTTFAAFSPDEEKKWVRFGGACANGAGGTGKNETALVTLRFDYRLA